MKATEMSGLVSNVLDLMRFESGQIVTRRDWQSLDDLAAMALQSLEERLRGTLWSCGFRMTCRMFSSRRASSCRCSRICSTTSPNTLLPAPRSWFRPSPTGTFVRVTVDDNGPGLPPGDPARLFDKFQRGAQEGTAVGVGLGLAICKAIVTAHGGDIVALPA